MRTVILTAAAAAILVAGVAVVLGMRHQGPSQLEREAHRRAVLNCRLSYDRYSDAYTRCVTDYTARYLDRLKDGHA